MYKICFCLLLGLVFVTEVGAQRRTKTKKLNAIEQAQLLLANKDYPQAIEVLQTEIEKQQKLRKPKLDVERMKIMVDSAQVSMMRIRNTQRIVVIDSIVLPKSKVIDGIHLSKDMGQVLLPTKLMSFVKNQLDPQGTLAFVNELNDHAFFSKESSNGNLMLYNSVRYGNKWETPQLVDFVANTDSIQGYPFMLTDGITLYYAAQGEDSYGGWDIFETRYDRDSNSFLRPQNLGMPFNTEYNDYLYVIDETTHTGYFATDRHHGPDSVCVYTFIPSNIYVTYSHETPFSEVLSAAYISDIRQTQLGRGKEIAQWEIEKKKTKKFDSKIVSNEFVINDELIYTSIGQFKNTVAREKAEEVLKLRQQKENAIKILDILRIQYAKENTQVLKEEILKTENELMQITQQLQKLEKEMRRLENAS